MRISGEINSYSQINRSLRPGDGHDQNHPVSNIPKNNYQNSPFRTQGFIENLTDRRAKLQEQIGKILAEEGSDPAKAQSRVEGIKKQIEELDELIEDAKVEKFEETASALNINHQAGTSNIVPDNANLDLINNWNSLSQVKMISGLKEKMEGEARVLKIEIELDRSRGASEENLKDKTEKLAEIEEKVKELKGDFGDKLNNLTEDVKEFEKVVTDADPENVNIEEYYRRISEENANLKIKIGKYTPDTSFGTGFGNVMIDPDYLKKAADNPEVAAELENYLADIPKFEEWYANIHPVNGMKLTGCVTVINEYGSLSSWSITRTVDPLKKSTAVADKIDIQEISVEYPKVRNEEVKRLEQAGGEKRNGAVRTGKMVVTNREAIKILKNMARLFEKDGKENSPISLYDIKL